MNLHDIHFRHLVKKDLHIHTQYCKHTRGLMEDYVLRAIELGLEEIGFLAHAEAGIHDPRVLWLEGDEYEAYWREGTELKLRYQGNIRVSLGLELGLNPNAIEELQEILRRRPWDRIGLSYHQLPDGDGHLNICSKFSVSRIREVDNLQLIEKYYRDLGDHIAAIRPYMLCHLDVVRKHMPDRSDDPAVRELILRLLARMQREGTRLEVNTAGYAAVGAPYPAPWILRSAVAMGIGLVLCSDSHAPEQVGRHFDEAIEYIEDCLDAGHAVHSLVGSLS